MNLNKNKFNMQKLPYSNDFNLNKLSLQSHTRAGLCWGWVGDGLGMGWGWVGDGLGMGRGWVGDGLGLIIRIL